MKFLAILFCFLTQITTRAQVLKYPSLSSSGYQTLSKMTEDLKLLCPEDKCLMIFLGRSNILLSAKLEAERATNLVTLPMSGIMRIPEDQLFEAGKNLETNIFSPLLKDKLKSYNHFAIIDYTNSGESLKRSSLMINQFMNKEVKDYRLQVIAYGKGLKSEALADFQNLNIIVNQLSAGPMTKEGDFLYFVDQSMAEKFAPFDQYTPLEGKPLQPFQRNRRLSYPYIVDPAVKQPTHYASYNDIVEWFSDPEIEKKLYVPRNQCDILFLR
jgi:hypothetical protein